MILVDLHKQGENGFRGQELHPVKIVLVHFGGPRCVHRISGKASWRVVCVGTAPVGTNEDEAADSNRCRMLAEPCEILEKLC